jgi:hypothetical protein
MSRTAADGLMDALEAIGVRRVFGLIGDSRTYRTGEGRPRADSPK